MKISKADLDVLCEICRELNEKEENELFEKLNNVILNILN